MKREVDKWLVSRQEIAKLSLQELIDEAKVSLKNSYRIAELIEDEGEEANFIKALGESIELLNSLTVHDARNGHQRANE
jgi:hypothetical protein